MGLFYIVQKQTPIAWLLIGFGPIIFEEKVLYFCSNFLFFHASEVENDKSVCHKWLGVFLWSQCLLLCRLGKSRATCVTSTQLVD